MTLSRGLAAMNAPWCATKRQKSPSHTSHDGHRMKSLMFRK